MIYYFLCQSVCSYNNQLALSHPADPTLLLIRRVEMEKKGGAVENGRPRAYHRSTYNPVFLRIL